MKFRVFVKNGSKVFEQDLRSQLDKQGLSSVELKSFGDLSALAQEPEEVGLWVSGLHALNLVGELKKITENLNAPFQRISSNQFPRLQIVPPGRDFSDSVN